MKKLMLIMAAAFAMVACQTDINEVGVVADGVATVEFEVGAPQMRSFSDGMTANKLQYAVYEVKADESLVYLENLPYETKTLVGGKTNVQIELAKNKKYSIIFWASADFSDVADEAKVPYTFNPAAKTVTVNYNGAVCNDEKRDAFFYAIKGLNPANISGTQIVNLYRPFAQLNFATTVGDMNESVADPDLAGLHNKAAVTVKNVANTLNLFTGETCYIDANNHAENAGAAVIIPDTEFPKVKVMQDGKEVEAYPTIEVSPLPTASRWSTPS